MHAASANVDVRTSVANAPTPISPSLANLISRLLQIERFKCENASEISASSASARIAITGIAMRSSSTIRDRMRFPRRSPDVSSPRAAFEGG